jgi:hypothetical protein
MAFDVEHEIAKCRAERDEALAQQAAASEILQVNDRKILSPLP